MPARSQLGGLKLVARRESKKQKEMGADGIWRAWKGDDGRTGGREKSSFVDVEGAVAWLY